MMSHTTHETLHAIRPITNPSPRARRATAAAMLAAVLIASACGRNEQSNSNISSVTSEAPSPYPSSAPSGTMANSNTASCQAMDTEGRYADEPSDAAKRSGSERYARIVENPFLTAASNPLSTFSIDVDTASYSNTRRFLKDGQLPPADAVRIEELVNYFGYDYPQPVGDVPFSVNAEVSECPWQRDHRLVRIGLKGKDVDRRETPPRNLVFLIDVSGSMQGPDRLGLVKASLEMLARQLTAQDRVAIVVYAGAAGLALPSTPGDRTNDIMGAIKRLEAGGSTAGGAGIQLAYKVASDNFVRGGINRVILATDGDFNVGVTNQAELEQLIAAKRASGVFLSVLGVGTGNTNDAMMESIADKGNGNYAYLDSREEARKVLVEQVGGTLVTIAKDVKIQVEFNPSRVGGYRLIGYENRALANRDFDDDTKDAGEIGAGHTVTALYEVVPAGQPIPAADGSGMNYEQPARRHEMVGSDELLTVRLRYKEPDGDTSRRIDAPVVDRGGDIAGASPDFKFAAAVAEFGMLLRGSQYKGDATYGRVTDLASGALGSDANGYRSEFLGLVRTAQGLNRRN